MKTLKLDDGTEIKLQYDLNAFCVIEEALGLESMEDFLDVLSEKNISFRKVRSLVWAGALKHQPDITEKEIGGGLSNFVEAITIATQAVLEGMPKVTDNPTPAKGKKPKAA